MAYSFQKTYTLIAQTPMIHFQHDQNGATLRATEVKPKLDRYLIKCAKEEKIDEKILSSWYIKCNSANNRNGDKENDDKDRKEHNAFNYQMKIQKKGNPTDSQITLDECKFYFGNQGNVEKKELVFNNCEMQIVCFVPELLKFIDKHIGSFFVLNNFGTRQTKGFGGFTLKYKKEDGNVYEQTYEDIENAVKNSKQLYFYAVVPDSDMNSIKNRMNHALTVYSVMKTGLNMTRYNEDTKKYIFEKRYIKGFAMRPYFEKCTLKKIGSDKAFIKSKVHITDNGDKKDALDRDYEGYDFIRAVFGLAEQYEFRDRYRNNGLNIVNKNGKNSYNYTPVGVSIIACPKNIDGTPKIDKQVINQDFDEAKKRLERKAIASLKKNSDIQRFASPVTIKIYHNRIYFLFNDSYKQVLDKMFLFVSFKKYGKNTVYEDIKHCLEKRHYISTPKDFDMNKFIEYFISYFNDGIKAKLGEFADPYRNSKNLTLTKGGNGSGNE